MNMLIKPQQHGPITFRPWSILNVKLTPIRKGDKITLRPKVTFHSPADVAARGIKYKSKQKVTFTREQRINAAKVLRRSELAKCAADVKEARETFYRLMTEAKGS